MTHKTGIFRLAAAGLLYHWKQHLAVLLGTALAAAVLLGALMIGDSVRYSLEQHVYDRLGRTAYAFEGGERFVTAGLADRIAGGLQDSCVPVLRLNAIAVKNGGKIRVNNVQVLGVDERFWSLARKPVSFVLPASGAALVNRSLAARLGAAPGEEILFKIEKPGLMPAELPLLRGDDQTVSMRLTIAAVCLPEALGDFSLQESQAVPLTVFIPLAALQAATGLADRANLLLIAQQKTVQAGHIASLVKRSFTLADAGLTLTAPAGTGRIILDSDRIFMDDTIKQAAYRADPGARGSFSYFVNSFRINGSSTPYSFITGLEAEAGIPAPTGTGMVINSWLASDLGAQPGDRITIDYFIQGTGTVLMERSAVFTVEAVIPVAAAAGAGELVPRFPGLTDADNCRDWKPGIPLKLELIRDQDEKYWNQYRALPKAFISLEAAQAMWANRFGSLTTVHYPAAGLEPEHLAEQILANLDPASLGISFKPVLAGGLEAARRGIDFGSLFLGLSCFVIAAALFLTILLFQFNIEKSAAEIGLYLALGINRGRVQLILFIRGLLLALAGSLLGILPAIVYNQAVLYGLETIWKSAVGAAYLRADTRGATIILGVFAGTLLSAFTLWLAIRKTVRRPVTELLRQESPGSRVQENHKPTRSFFLAGLCLAGTLGLLCIPLFYPAIDKAGIFFTAGSLLLAGFLACINGILSWLEKRKPSVRFTLGRAGVRNFIRRRKHTLLSIGLLAAGIFCVVSVGANRKNLPADVYARNSGTGGYRLFVETSLPLLPGFDAGQPAAVPAGSALQGVEFLHARVQEAADASCLNLNYIKQPQLLGIAAGTLSGRSSFSFTAVLKDVDPKNPWLYLEQETDSSSVPGFIDATVLTWNLGKTLGDTISYTDEQGREFTVRLAGTLDDTVFQGKILIAEKEFIKRFPSVAGYKLLLVDAPAASLPSVKEELSAALQNYGPEFQLTGDRLAAFHEVENTYLLIYLLLGGLGLIIGTTGFAVVVMRKIADSGNEPAMLRALGFRFPALLRYILAENLPILATGLLSGVAASFVALLPLYAEAPGRLPLAFTGLLILGMLFNGIFWILVLSSLAVSRHPAADLRKE